MALASESKLIGNTKGPRQFLKGSELIRLAELGRVSASLIHEMTTPLTAATLVLDNMSDEHEERDLKLVRRNLRLIERYVVAARQQLNGDSQPASFSLTVAIHQVAMILSARAKEANVRLLINSIGSIRLYGDKVKFQQIISNLLNNAIDAYNDRALPKRLINVLVERIGEKKLSITVTDHGCGITPEQFEHVFEPFYSTKRKDKRGIGIGLDITKRYVEKDFNGTIKASSNPKSGTSFKLTIPFNKN
ncbi:MAG: sensor histidine kinase [Candidatus Saccharimonadales bacterium]